MSSIAYGIVFPGQGSQSVGMLGEIAKQYPEVKQTFDEASQVLGFDLWQLVAEGPKSNLDQTQHTQPALLAASYAIWQILKNRHPLKPAMLAGHSLGEYTALVAAEALDFKEAIRLVALRGQWMQDAVPAGQGAMAAILGLDEEQVITICEQSTNQNEMASPANFNTIGQIVIAGHQHAVMNAMTLAKEAGAKAILLPVSVPSHCALMTPAAEQLAATLHTISFKKPTFTVLKNSDATPYDSAASIPAGLTKQLTMPVQWIAIIRHFIKQGVHAIIECGPGKVLTGLNKRIDPSLTLMMTCDTSSLEGLSLG
jgi:[acyl-carrier-protein] S-malonyltransferase